MTLQELRLDSGWASSSGYKTAVVSPFTRQALSTPPVVRREDHLFFHSVPRFVDEVMTSPYLHRAGASSLPNDYAIVSHFAEENSLLGYSDDEEEALLNDLPVDDTLSGSPKRYLGIPIRRRPSLSHYGSTRTSKYDSSSTESQEGRRPSFASISHLNGPSWRRIQEQDALLANVPRIEEPVGYHTEQTQALTEAQIWLQEAKIIWRYTLPIFG